MNQPAVKYESQGVKKRPAITARLLGAALLLLPFPIAAIAKPIIIRDAYPICFFRIMTGKPCPFCGLTRAYAYATHGQFALATSMNPIWWIVAAMMVGFAALLTVDAFRTSRLAAIAADRILQHSRWWMVGLGVFEIWRLCAGR